MKKHFTLSLCITIIVLQATAQSANKTLSNLISPTAVNVNLLPQNNNTQNLGSSGKSWKNLYVDGKSYLKTAYTYFNNASQQFRINNIDDRLVIDSSGKIGIGTLSPLARFHINGDAGKDAFRVQINGLTKLYVNSGGGVAVGASTTPPANGLYVAGNVGIGTSVPSVKLNVVGGSDASLAGGGYIVAGSIGSSNIVIDENEIMARNNGVSNTLLLNNDGGDVNVSAGALFVESTTNRIGIGTTVPQVRLHVSGGTDAEPASGGYIVAGSTTSANLAIDNNEIMARNNGVPSTLYFNDDGGDLVMCYEGGNVMIGTKTPAAGYILSVDGKGMFEEIKVQTSSNWPDYVFDDNHKLPSLYDLESSIKTQKHLPGIPSAKEINKEGILIGDMQTKMMEKIEELTLYIISLQKQIDELKKIQN
jgi:hypothetical protein